MTQKTKYYGIAGKNGYGVFDDYGRLQEKRIYLRKARVKSFSSFESAKEYAEDIFWMLQNDRFRFSSIEEIKKKNWMYYRETEE